MMIIIGVVLAIFCIGGLSYGIYRVREKYVLSGLFIAFISLLILVGSFVLISFGMKSESFKRWTKDMQSNYTGGLQRTIQVVNNDGKVLKEYKGKMDIQENDGQKIIFVMDGNKYIIYNNSVFTTVFVEEQVEE